MVLALLLALNLADWVPARWTSNDPATLDLVAESPVNCLLMEQRSWSPAFRAQAAKRGIAVLGVIRPDADLEAVLQSANDARLDGVVLEGDFPAEAAGRFREAKLITIELLPRDRLRPNAAAPLIGTNQGVWPGVRSEVKAAATGGPWIDTNSGFLRMVRAATDVPVWIGNLPPPKTVIPALRYMQVIGDAAAIGARWIVALDDDLNRRLLARDPAALRDWKRIGAELRFFEEHKEWRGWKPYGELALIQEPDSGAMLSGGILDMIATKHTPVRPVPVPKLSEASLKGTSMAVNVDPAALQPSQKEALRSFTRSGGTLLNGPPGWKMPQPRPGQIVLDQKQTEQIDDIWKGINSMIGRTNLGARLFNVAGMLSSLYADGAGKRVVLELVNYTDYPIESVTVYVLGKFQRAHLYEPEAPARDLPVYEVEEGTGVDLPQVPVTAALVLE